MEFFSEFRCYRSICHSGDSDHINICRGYLALCVSCTIYMVRGSSDILVRHSGAVTTLQSR